MAEEKTDPQMSGAHAAPEERPPLSLSYSDGFPALLDRLGVSLSFSTY